MRSRSALALVALLSATSPACAQSADSPAAAYVELGGNGLIYTVNIERLVVPHVIVRAGFEALPDLFGGDGNWSTAVPLMATFVAGRHGHMVEAGFGVVLGLGRCCLNEIDFTGGASSTLTIGYRRQHGNRIFRVGYTPVFQFQRSASTLLGYVLSEPRRPWQDSFGISFGRTF